MSNIEYYVCNRFMTKQFPDYLEHSGLKTEEIVSVDCGLFPSSERRSFEEKSILAENEQVLAVLLLKQEEELPTLDEFTFCGYDLVDVQSEISALTNCPHLLEGVLSCVELNQYGLIEKREDAERLQKFLPEQYENDDHAYCELYAIWRKLSDRDS